MAKQHNNKKFAGDLLKITKQIAKHYKQKLGSGKINDPQEQDFIYHLSKKLFELVELADQWDTGSSLYVEKADDEINKLLKKLPRSSPFHHENISDNKDFEDEGEEELFEDEEEFEDEE